jgi:hypothetical protein
MWILATAVFHFPIVHNRISKADNYPLIPYKLEITRSVKQATPPNIFICLLWGAMFPFFRFIPTNTEMDWLGSQTFASPGGYRTNKNYSNTYFRIQVGQTSQK